MVESARCENNSARNSVPNRVHCAPATQSCLLACNYNRNMLRLNLAAGRLTLALFCVALSEGAAAQPASASLQSAVSRAMGNQRGAAVVLDVHSGQIIASSHLDVAARRVVPPGSSIKPFTLTGAAAVGKSQRRKRRCCVSALSRLTAASWIALTRRRIEPLDPAEALAYSCNSYFTRWLCVLRRRSCRAVSCGRIHLGSRDCSRTRFQVPYR